MTRDEYAASVCARLDQAVAVPFQPVAIAKIADCHMNADAWVAANPNYQTVRGWVKCASFGDLGARLTAHSVVRTPEGKLLDITPLADESLRGGMHFIEHEGSERLFFAAKEGSVFIDCLTCQ